jgi:hypothetical protein
MILSRTYSLYATINFLKGLRIARHNAVIHQITNLLKSNVYTRHNALIIAGNQHGNHQDNTILPWILSCTCNTTRCECLAKLRPDIIYTQGVAYEQNGPLIPTPDLTIQIIESLLRMIDSLIKPYKKREANTTR